jgi:hypothetical protein
LELAALPYERWQTPDGDMVTAPLPAGIDEHFGRELRRFVLAQYHQGQMTVPWPRVKRPSVGASPKTSPGA